MKLNEAKREVQTEGFDNGNHIFSIKQSPRAFQILSSNIYSDKILAVVREYGCNALDAHKMVNKANVPFDVHLPNQYEPFFKIRDFGPGLSDENVTILFTTYFESTKDSSNDFTGCLGLGSKSAFSYVDQFGIISYFNGERTFFSAYLNENNVPQITLVSKEPSNEESGLEINMAVKPSDFSAFKDKAGQIFKRFPVAPNFTGNSIQLDKIEYTLIGKKYRLLKTYNYRDSRSASVLQGCVQYPIDIESFNIPVSELQKSVLKHSIELDFEIGELNITASRERLNYDKVTQQNILNKVNEVVAEIKKDMKDKIDKVSSVYEARLLFANTMYFGGLIATIMNSGITYKNDLINTANIRIDFTEEVPLMDPITNLQVKDLNGKPKTKIDHFGTLATYDRYKLNNKNPVQNSSDTWDRYDASSLFNGKDYFPHKTYVFVLKDISGVSVGPIIKHNFEDKVYKVVIINLNDMSRLPELIEQFEGYPEANIFKLSALERPPKVVKAKVKKDAVAVRKFLHVGSIYQDGTFSTEEKEVDANKGGYYLMSYSGGVINEGVDLTAEYKDIAGISSNKKVYMRMLYNLKEMASRTRDTALLDILNNIYIINSSYKEIPLNNKDWVLAYDALKPFINKMYSNDLGFVSLAMSVAAMNSNTEKVIFGCFEEKAPTPLMKSMKTEFASILLKLKARNLVVNLPSELIMKTMASGREPTDTHRFCSSTIKYAMTHYKDFLLSVSNYYDILKDPTKGKSLDSSITTIMGKIDYYCESIEFVPKILVEDKLLQKIFKSIDGRYGVNVEDILNLLKNKYKS